LNAVKQQISVSVATTISREPAIVRIEISAENAAQTVAMRMFHDVSDTQTVASPFHRSRSKMGFPFHRPAIRRTLLALRARVEIIRQEAIGSRPRSWLFSMLRAVSPYNPA
jgi:hypothetical protein